MTKPLMTAAQARQVFDYDQETGVIRWLRSPRITIAAGTIAGTINQNGYRRIGYRWRIYLAHRVAWLLVKGEWPSGHIDHINGIRDDNRFCNLRGASSSQNQQNMKTDFGTASGCAGIKKRGNSYQVRFNVYGKHHYFGTFRTRERALEVRNEAVQRLRGEYGRLGK
jgi:hypothetical protein